MRENTTKILLSPFFIIGLFVLLLNDFFLKSYFGNFLTGKLSDFAGLFVFPLFWAAFFPKRKLSIFVGTAVFFAFWKSPFSDDFISLWNSLPLFDVERTVDYGDLVALAVLPLAWTYSQRSKPIRLPRVSQRLTLTALALISLFAFTATSQAPRNEVRFNQEYEIQKSPLDLAKRLQDIKTGFLTQTRSESRKISSYSVELNEKICDGMPTAHFRVFDTAAGHSKLELEYIVLDCEVKLPDQREKLKKMFETEVVDFLKNDQAS